MRIRQEHAYSPPAGRGGGADQSNAALPSCRQRRGGLPVLRFSSALPGRCRAKEAQHLFDRHDRPSPREGTKRCPVVVLKNATSRFWHQAEKPVCTAIGRNTVNLSWTGVPAGGDYACSCLILIQSYLGQV